MEKIFESFSEYLNKNLNEGYDVKSFNDFKNKIKNKSKSETLELEKDSEVGLIKIKFEFTDNSTKSKKDYNCYTYTNYDFTHDELNLNRGGKMIKTGSTRNDNVHNILQDIESEVKAFEKLK